MTRRSSGDRMGCSKYSRRHCNSLGSKIFASGPIGHASDMTIRSRNGSIGGLVTLKLNPAKMQLISGFIDTYLRLNKIEEDKFQIEVGTLITE